MLEKNTILEKRYKILEIIKVGLRGSVYLALDTHLPGKNWVIKEIFSSGKKEKNNEDIWKEIRNKAGVLSQLDYISLPRLMDFFIFSENSYLVFDYVEGKSLRDLVDTHQFFEEHVARNYILQMADTSIYFQKHSITDVFIDLKPENIFLDCNGILKFVDFGIHKFSYENSKIYYSNFLENALTPKQEIEDDFMALGIMFYFLLSGNSILTVSEINKSISLEAETIIFNCLNKKYISWENFISDFYSFKKEQEQDHIPMPSISVSSLEETEEISISSKKEQEKMENTVIILEKVNPPSKGIDVISEKKDIIPEAILPAENKFHLKPSFSLLLFFSIVVIIIVSIFRVYFSHDIENSSGGKKVSELISPLKPEELKDRALYYYSMQDYTRASALLKRHILNYPADGEAHIYLSNSQILEEKDEKIYIGLAIPVSGNDSQTGQAVMQGIALAQKEINSQNILKKKIIFVIKNDKSNPETAEEIAKNFIEDEKILAVIGHTRSVCTLAAAKIYNEGKIPHISPVSTNPYITGNYTFSTCANDISQGEMLSEIAEKSLKANRIATIYNLYDPYSISLSSSFKTSSKLNFVSEVHYNFTDDDFREYGQLLINSSPDLIFIAAYDTEALSIIKQLRQEGYKGNLLGGDALYTQKMIEQGGKATDGLICTTFFYPDLSRPDIRNFVKNFEKLFGGGTPNPIAAQAYDAANLLVYGLSNSKFTREELREKLSEIGNIREAYKGVGGEIRFDKNGNTKKLWIVVQIQNGKFVPYKPVP